MSALVTEVMLDYVEFLKIRTHGSLIELPWLKVVALNDIGELWFTLSVSKGTEFARPSNIPAYNLIPMDG